MRTENKYKPYRFEFEYLNDTESWGWDAVEALNFRDAKKWIFAHYPTNEYRINYIAEIKYEYEED